MGSAAVLTLIILAACQHAPAREAIGSDTASADTGRNWARGAVFYEVFVRSFADSDGDGLGDLNGLREHLDALNDGSPGSGDDLEVDALWLMPVFAASSDHGYDVTDYRSVAPALGTLDDFEALIQAAHQRGLRIVVDLVLNHTSDQHPWFRESAASTDNARRDWYLWRDQDPGWVQPWSTAPSWHQRSTGWYHGLFSPGMPDLNLENPQVERELLDVAAAWLRRGVDGFRLDAARHLIAHGSGAGQSDQPETLHWWRRFGRQLHQRFPAALLLGEVWSDTQTIARYLGSDDGGPPGLDGAFNFPLARAIEQAVRDADPAALRAVVDEAQASYANQSIDATFAGNHDLPRLARRLGADSARLSLAHAILLSLPGTPVIYYGDELGMLGSDAPGDLAQRTPFPWGDDGTSTADWTSTGPVLGGAPRASQLQDAASSWSAVRHWIAERRRLPALRQGSLRWVDCGPQVLAFVRGHTSGSVLVIHNLGTTRATCARPGRESLRSGQRAPVLVSPKGGDTIVVPAAGSRLVELDSR
ncbi:MAG: alpha-amylase family glycosyl hydrolase [Pseudomonadota bacterium]